MTNLTGQIGELRFTIEVTRKDTGVVDTYEMIGTIIPDEDEGGESDA